MAHSQSELQVITFAKNLCSYVMTITQKSPKQFRFLLIGRMQGYRKTGDGSVYWQKIKKD